MRTMIVLSFLMSPVVAFAQHGPPWTLPKSDFGGAAPLNASDWFGFEDYPESAVRAGQQGYVTVAFRIGTDGRVAECAIVRSSGYASLDNVPCRLLKRKAKFHPALDADGLPQSTQATTSMQFWLPYG